MAADESIDSGLLGELHELASFRRRYSSEQPRAQLDAQDPDVQRLVEVLAYSAVRTRQAVLRNLSATWRRLLGGYFQPLLRPLPAMAILEAQVTARMTERMSLPSGTEIRIEAPDGTSSTFQTLADLHVTPMTLDRCDLLRRGTGPYRLVLGFGTRIARTDAVGTLRLHLDCLDDYLAALSVHQQLERHFLRAFAVYDLAVHDSTEGPSCQVRFGRVYDEPYEAEEANPLESVRDFMHCPEQDLLIHITVPPPRRAWTRLSVCIELDAAWPRKPAIYRETFRPFTVPVRNLRRSPAQPIECDGTQDAYPLRFVHPDASYSLHGVHGVYQMTAEGLAPIPPAALSGSTPSYEIEREGQDPAGGSAASLLLRMPQALLEPVRIAVEGTWYQPALQLAGKLRGRLDISVPDRSLLGLDLALVGPVRPALDTQLSGDPAALLRLLSLKMKAVLDLADLNALFVMLESPQNSPFRGFIERIKDLAVEVTPDETVRGAGIRHVYHLLVDVAAEEEPLWITFCQKLQQLLDAWDYEGRAEVRRHGSPSQMPAGKLRRR